MSFKNLNIKTKLLICFIFITLFSIPTQYYSINYTYDITQAFNRISDITLPKIQALFHMQDNANAIKAQTLNFNFNQVSLAQAEGTPGATYKYNVLANLAEIEKWESQYEKYSKLDAHGNSLQLSALDKVKDQIILVSLKIMELTDQKAPIQLINDAKQNLISYQDQLTQLINTGISNELKYINNLQEETYSKAINLIRLAVAIALLTFLASIIISLWLAHTIAKPIVYLSQLSTAIARNEVTKSADLDEKILVHSKDEVGQLSKNLVSMIHILWKSNALLSEKNQELQTTLASLKNAQNNLIESEKMACIGNLVASVSHEVNTPLGIGITAISHLAEKFDQVEDLLVHDELKRSEFESFLHSAKEAVHLTSVNLNRSLELIKGFKQISADNTSDVKRIIQLDSYIKEILISLKPILRKTLITVSLDCPEGITLETYPGVIFQILTIFITNSIVHAFEPNQAGEITITVIEKEKEIILKYQDSGKGISEENLKKIFTPFFTTKRNAGGVGLGLYIAYTKVLQVLHGSLTCESELGDGVTFTIQFPKKTKD